MKYRLIIDKDADEEIIVRVRFPNELTAEIENLVNAYADKGYITANGEDGIIRLDFADIECITVIDRKIYVINTDGEKLRVNQRLCDLEGILPSYFIRINKSTIVNENRILRFNTVYSGAVDAHLKCGYKDYVSRRCFAEIKRRLNVK